MGLLEALADGRKLRRAAQPKAAPFATAAPAAHPQQQHHHQQQHQQHQQQQQQQHQQHQQQPQQPRASSGQAAPSLSLLERLGDGRQQRRRAGAEVRPPPGLEQQLPQHAAGLRGNWANPVPDSQSSAYAPAAASSSTTSQLEPSEFSQSAHVAIPHTDTSDTSRINRECDSPAKAAHGSYSGNDHGAGADSRYAQAIVSSEATVASSSDTFATTANGVTQSATAAAVGTQDAPLAKPAAAPEQGQGCQETMGHCQPTEAIFSSLPPTAETHGASVEAIVEFKASSEFELSLEVGDQLVLTHANVRGFFGGQNMETKQRGWFPERCVAMAPKSKRLEREPEMAPEPAPDLSDQAGKEKTPQHEQRWERYTTEENRLWYWNSVSKDWFWADESAKSGWFKYETAEGSKKFWWWHEATGRFFMDQPGAVGAGQ